MLHVPSHLTLSCISLGNRIFVFQGFQVKGNLIFSLKNDLTRNEIKGRASCLRGSHPLCLSIHFSMAHFGVFLVHFITFNRAGNRNSKSDGRLRFQRWFNAFSLSSCLTSSICSLSVSLIARCLHNVIVILLQIEKNYKPHNKQVRFFIT